MAQICRMTREPHIHTPAHDPVRREPGTVAWWREWYHATGGKKPDWWDRVFSQPFEEKADG